MKLNCDIPFLNRERYQNPVMILTGVNSNAAFQQLEQFLNESKKTISKNSIADGPICEVLISYPKVYCNNAYKSCRQSLMINY